MLDRILVCFEIQIIEHNTIQSQSSCFSGKLWDWFLKLLNSIVIQVRDRDEKNCDDFFSSHKEYDIALSLKQKNIGISEILIKIEEASN